MPTCFRAPLHTVTGVLLHDLLLLATFEYIFDALSLLLFCVSDTRSLPVESFRAYRQDTVTWRSVVNIIVRNIKGFSNLRLEIGGALFSYTYTIIVVTSIATSLSSICSAARECRYGLKLCMRLAISILGRASTSSAPKRLLTWTLLLPMFGDDSTAQALYLAVEDCTCYTSSIAYSCPRSKRLVLFL